MAFDLDQAQKESGIRRCEQCGATYPWHFQECAKLHGGEELQALNYEEEYEYKKEPTVSREQGARILEAIMYMLRAPNKDDFAIRKAAVQAEIGDLTNDRQTEIESGV